MLKKETVFIIGAGASFEFGLPTGAKLQQDIAASLDIRFTDFGRLISGSVDIWQAIERLNPRDRRGLQHAAWRIRDGIPLANSIDNFMHVHQNDAEVQLVGKLAIANAIAIAETNSSLAIDRRQGTHTLDFSSLSGTWLLKLFKILQEDVTKPTLETLFDKCVFLTFNYDRCLEHFLLHATSTYYQITLAEAAKVVSNARIRHVYGSLGPLDWQPHEGPLRSEFGQRQNRIEDVAALISTYGEQMRDPTAVEEWLKWIEDAEQICFLGFSFQGQNVRLITPSGGFKADVVGTSHGISEFDRTAIVEDLRTKLSHTGWPIRLEPVTCSSLFDSFSRAFK